MKNFGQTIKRLRKQKDITQEQLAEYLNISSQSVSKWETNLTLPDITFIPMLANIFDVSSDTLLGIDITEKEKRIQEIVDEAVEYKKNDKLEQSIEILRTGLKNFPNSYRILSELMSCVWLTYSYDGTEKEEEKLYEVIEIGEKILAESTDDECRYNAIQILSFSYSWVGQSEKAIALAEKMPRTLISRQNLLVNAYSGVKKFEQSRLNLSDEVTYIIDNMRLLDNPDNPYTIEERIIICKKSIELLNLMYDDNLHGFYSFQKSDCILEIAKLYVQLGDYDSAITNLKLAAENVISNDEKYNPDAEETSLLFRGMKVKGFYYNINGNDCKLMLYSMEKSAFDPIRENPEFIETEERLKKYANKND